MVHGYHLILPMYGFWLPNDPRGSWSDYVRSWELARFGKATPRTERKELVELTEKEIQLRDAAKRALKFPPVLLTGVQAAGVGRGFATKISISNYTVWACSILPDHTHLVLARHSYKVETIANLLKGAATGLARIFHPPDFDFVFSEFEFSWFVSLTSRVFAHNSPYPNCWQMSSDAQIAEPHSNAIEAASPSRFALASSKIF